MLQDCESWRRRCQYAVGTSDNVGRYVAGCASLKLRPLRRREGGFLATQASHRSSNCNNGFAGMLPVRPAASSHCVTEILERGDASVPSTHRFAPNLLYSCRRVGGLWRLVGHASHHHHTTAEPDGNGRPAGYIHGGGDWYAHPQLSVDEERHGDLGSNLCQLYHPADDPSRQQRPICGGREQLLRQRDQ